MECIAAANGVTVSRDFSSISDVIVNVLAGPIVLYASAVSFAFRPRANQARISLDTKTILRGIIAVVVRLCHDL